MLALIERRHRPGNCRGHVASPPVSSQTVSRIEDQRSPWRGPEGPKCLREAHAGVIPPRLEQTPGHSDSEEGSPPQSSPTSPDDARQLPGPAQTSERQLILSIAAQNGDKGSTNAGVCDAAGPSVYSHPAGYQELERDVAVNTAGLITASVNVTITPSALMAGQGHGFDTLYPQRAQTAERAWAFKHVAEPRVAQGVDLHAEDQSKDEPRDAGLAGRSQRGDSASAGPIEGMKSGETDWPTRSGLTERHHHFSTSGRAEHIATIRESSTRQEGYLRNGTMELLTDTLMSRFPDDAKRETLSTGERIDTLMLRLPDDAKRETIARDRLLCP